MKFSKDNANQWIASKILVIKYFSLLFYKILIYYSYTPSAAS